MSASDWSHLDFEKIVAETAAAFLVRLADDREVWIPKSVVADPDDYDADRDHNGGTISVKEWFAKKEGLV